MSLAIKFGDLQNQDENALKGIIYFDAVTAYTKSYGGKVTSHPIEAGASISDHFISENPKFSISGVISCVDLSPIPFKLSDSETLGGKINNAREKELEKVETSNLGSGLMRFLPGSVNQFLPRTKPNVIMDEEAVKNHKMDVESLFSRIMTELYFNEKRKMYENRMTLITLYELDDITPSKPIEDLVLTSFSSREDPDSGDALFFDLSFEKVNFVTLEKADKPAVGTKEQKKAQPNSEKGNQPSNAQPANEEPAQGVTRSPATAPLNGAPAGGG